MHLLRVRPGRYEGEGDLVSRIEPHDVTLRSDRVALRPMTEDDMALLCRWESEPEVRCTAVDSKGDVRTAEQIKDFYLNISRNGFCFIIEFDGVPIGYGWLKRLTSEDIQGEFPGKDVRQIDLTIAEKAYWGRGIGTMAIELLTEFGFEFEGADVLIARDVGDHNPRGRRAFEKDNYSVWRENRPKDGCGGGPTYDLILRKEDFRPKTE